MAARRGCRGWLGYRPPGPGIGRSPWWPPAAAASRASTRLSSSAAREAATSPVQSSSAPLARSSRSSSWASTASCLPSRRSGRPASSRCIGRGNANAPRRTVCVSCALILAVTPACPCPCSFSGLTCNAIRATRPAALRPTVRAIPSNGTWKRLQLLIWGPVPVGKRVERLTTDLEFVHRFGCDLHLTAAPNPCGVPEVTPVSRTVSSACLRPATRVSSTVLAASSHVMRSIPTIIVRAELVPLREWGGRPIPGPVGCVGEGCGAGRGRGRRGES